MENPWRTLWGTSWGDQQPASLYHFSCVTLFFCFRLSPLSLYCVVSQILTGHEISWQNKSNYCFQAFYFCLSFLNLSAAQCSVTSTVQQLNSPRAAAACLVAVSQQNKHDFFLLITHGLTFKSALRAWGKISPSKFTELDVHRFCHMHSCH